MLAAYGVLSPQDAHPHARAAAERALQLDNSLASPIVLLAGLKQEDEWVGRRGARV
jgi:hypothetical protein